jgi:hypothetical protein
LVEGPPHASAVLKASPRNERKWSLAWRLSAAVEHVGLRMTIELWEKGTPVTGSE